MKDYKVDKESFSESFRKEVYEVVSQIPVGKVSTYGGIALLLGAPQCSRMVGRALKEVPDELSIPCHRVVGSNGSLTGYAGGIEKKVQLLTMEKIDMSAFFVPKKGTAL